MRSEFPRGGGYARHVSSFAMRSSYLLAWRRAFGPPWHCAFVPGAGFQPISPFGMLTAPQRAPARPHKAAPSSPPRARGKTRAGLRGRGRWKVKTASELQTTDGLCAALPISIILRRPWDGLQVMQRSQMREEPRIGGRAAAPRVPTFSACAEEGRNETI